MNPTTTAIDTTIRFQDGKTFVYLRHCFLGNMHAVTNISA